MFIVYFDFFSLGTFVLRILEASKTSINSRRDEKDSEFQGLAHLGVIRTPQTSLRPELIGGASQSQILIGGSQLTKNSSLSHQFLFGQDLHGLENNRRVTNVRTMRVQRSGERGGRGSVNVVMYPLWLPDGAPYSRNVCRPLRCRPI